MKRDGFRCRYRGFDGTASFSNWLQVSEDHLQPKGHPLRNDTRYRVCACRFFNECDNLYFSRAEKRGLVFEERSREELLEQRRPYVLAARERYQEF